MTVVTDAIAGVDRKEGDAERALEQMREAGANLRTSAELEEEGWA